MRKSQQFKVETAGRDKGKVFLLTEMPAAKAEMLALRVFMSLAKSGVEIPANVEEMGMAGLLRVGFGLLAHLPFEEAEMLMGEMMACVQRMHEPSNPASVIPLMEDDIEEVSTRFQIRKALKELHLGFSKVAGK